MKTQNASDFFDHNCIMVEIMICSNNQLGLGPFQMPTFICDQTVSNFATKLWDQLLIVAQYDMKRLGRVRMGGKLMIPVFTTF